MNRRVDELVLDILVAIDYPNDKDKYVREFLQINHIDTVLNILERLPEETQTKIKAIKTQEEVAEEIKKYIQPDEYVTELSKVSAEALQRFINGIFPTLNQIQKERVLKIIQK